MLARRTRSAFATEPNTALAALSQDDMLELRMSNPKINDAVSQRSTCHRNCNSFLCTLTKIYSVSSLPNNELTIDGQVVPFMKHAWNLSPAAQVGGTFPTEAEYPGHYGRMHSRIDELQVGLTHKAKLMSSCSWGRRGHGRGGTLPA